MIHRVKLPRLGDTADEVVVLEVLVAPGDTVMEGQAVLSVETDKIDAEVVAPISGTVAEVLVAEDDEVKVGDVILLVQR